jgi:DNA-binding transcriptional MerR regulator
MALTGSQVAKLAGVTVRTLHHYDELGLVRPSQRSEAGYRLYEDRDLERLQQGLFFRELGFPLEEIARLVNDPSFDVRAALRMQRETHRQYIERWFYPCSRAMHRGLGELYVQDPRFTANIDRQHSGLAEFMRNAFRANAERTL